MDSEGKAEVSTSKRDQAMLSFGYLGSRGVNKFHCLNFNQNKYAPHTLIIMKSLECLYNLYMRLVINDSIVYRDFQRWQPYLGGMFLFNK